MVFVRGIARPLVFIAIVVVFASVDVAEAGVFDGTIQGMFQQVQEIVDDVVSETVKKFSVLSNIFGEGVTRGDLSLPEIINGAFSRNNGIPVANNSADMDWQLGDGSSVIGAISNGGSVGVVNEGDQVTIYTGKKPRPKPKELEQDQDDGEQGAGEQEAGEPEASSEALISASGSGMDEAFFGLLSNWDDFVTSSIWDVQDKEGAEPATSSGASWKAARNLETSSRLINGVFFGNRVPSGASFAVKFFYNDEENFYCSGSLIGYPYVLTAAHCGIVIGDQVRVGGRLLRSGYRAKVGAVILHPEFEAGSLVHDLAIVRLENLVEKNELVENGVKAARINKRKDFPVKGFVGVLSGHGSAQTDGGGVSDELRTTRHTASEVSKCQEEITQGALDADDSYLCAGDGERSTTCVGDSGAGLWHYRVKTTPNGKTRKFYEIYAVVSFGEVTDEALCPRGPPTVFQRTSTNYEWIVEVVGKKNMP